MSDDELEELRKEVTIALMEEAAKTRNALPGRDWAGHWAGGMEAAAQVASMTISKHMSRAKP